MWRAPGHITERDAIPLEQKIGGPCRTTVPMVCTRLNTVKVALEQDASSPGRALVSVALARAKARGPSDLAVKGILTVVAVLRELPGLKTPAKAHALVPCRIPSDALPETEDETHRLTPKGLVRQAAARLPLPSPVRPGLPGTNLAPFRAQVITSRLSCAAKILHDISHPACFLHCRRGRRDRSNGLAYCAAGLDYRRCWAICPEVGIARRAGPNLLPRPRKG